ncbi:DUF4365 domain-containing protein [Micromonospora sp. NBC_00898]|uniref:DUF4365 domain-containing protein n=1 Tax=Micromonospora sp. NBC_00898 TaxID=2975981 RepID=UPI0038688D0A|nr:DUF4365 domain-containing protein [Micromonospora sp. NBC_00898]
MPGLPQRPSAHVNAQRSERAFATLFSDDNWVIRPVNPDYGRDLEVELFEDGEATGILFGVQLKSIEKAPRKGRLSKSGIETSSLRYWQSLDYPLLVATYSVPADQVYARWAHSYDWHYKSHAGLCDESCNPGPKTVTFNYRVDHRLTPEAVARLPEQLRFFRAARMGDLRRSPMPVRVDGESVDGHPLARTTEELGRIVAESGRIRFAKPDELAAFLTYTQAEIRAVLPGDLRSTTLHLDRGFYEGSQGHVALAADGVVALAYLLFQLHADNAAADLLMAVAPYSQALFRMNAHLTLAPQLLKAEREDVIEALAAEQLRRRPRRVIGPGLG